MLVNSILYHTMSTSFSVIRRPNSPVKPAKITPKWSWIKPFLVSFIWRYERRFKKRVQISAIFSVILPVMDKNEYFCQSNIKRL